MTMTVRDLMAELTNFDGDAEVRLMTQPSWPFEYDVNGVWQPSGGGRCELCGSEQDDETHGPEGDHAFEGGFAPDGAPEAGVVYLTEGTQLAYGTKEAWRD